MRGGRGGEAGRGIDRLRGNKVESTQSGIFQGSADRTQGLVLFRKLCLLSYDMMTEQPVGKSFVFSSIPKQNMTLTLFYSTSQQSKITCEISWMFHSLTPCNWTSCDTKKKKKKSCSKWLVGKVGCLGNEFYLGEDLGNIIWIKCMSVK